MRVLIIGGYGTFGGRLVDLLLDEPRLTLIVAGRNRETAVAFCAKRPQAAAKLVPALFDRSDPGRAMTELKPDIVVDAAGPFQLYGDDPYGAVRAALAAGAHWIDLADGAAFVTGISGLDAGRGKRGASCLPGPAVFRC